MLAWVNQVHLLVYDSVKFHVILDTKSTATVIDWPELGDQAEVSRLKKQRGAVDLWQVRPSIWDIFEKFALWKRTCTRTWMNKKKWTEECWKEFDRNSVRKLHVKELSWNFGQKYICRSIVQSHTIPELFNKTVSHGSILSQSTWPWYQTVKAINPVHRHNLPSSDRQLSYLVIYSSW